MVLKYFRYTRPAFLLTAFFCLFLLAGCAGKNAGDDLDKYPVDEEEIIDMNYEPRDDGKPLTDKELHAFRSLGQIDRDMPLEDSRIVELHFKYFVHERRGTFQRFLDRSYRYLPYMRTIFRERGIPEELVYISMAESGGNPVARSRAGAVGLWQFMPFTGRKYGLQQNTWIDERRDPFKATYAASDYLLKLYNDFNNWHLAMAAYNAGEGKIGRAIDGTGANSFFDLCRLDDKLDEKARLRTETRDYVPRIIAIAKIMRNLDRLGFIEPSPDTAYDLRPVAIPPGTNLSSLARNTGITWDEFVGMNPAYFRTASPPTQETTAYLPPDKLAQAQTWLAGNESRSFAGWKEYTIKKKDSLAAIAKRHKVTQAAIRDANGFAKLPKAGTTIMIPGSSTRVVEPVYEARSDKSDLASQSKGKYTVRSGDTLFTLAQKWGTSVDSIRLANRMGTSSSLSVGQRLTIPGNSVTAPVSRGVKPARAARGALSDAPAVQKSAAGVSGGTYTVKSGDTVGAIAQATGVSSKAIYEANGLTAKSTLRIGQVLTLPGRGSAAPQAVPAAAKPMQSKPAETATAALPSTATAKGGTVTVQKGDTLFSLARKHGTNVNALRKANNLTEKAHIKPGQKLKLP